MYSLNIESKLINMKVFRVLISTLLFFIKVSINHLNIFCELLCFDSYIFKHLITILNKYNLSSSGYTFDLVSNTCATCVADHCSYCTDNVNICTSCNMWYHLTDDFKCEKCVEGCAYCDNTSSCNFWYIV